MPEDHRDNRFFLMVAIGRFRRHAMRVFGAADECSTTEECIELYTELYDFHREVQVMLDAVQTRMVNITPRDLRYQAWPLPGSGVLKFSGGKERTRYDQPAVVGAFARGIADRVEDDFKIDAIVSEGGENIFPSSWHKIVHTIADKMAQAAGAMAPSFDSWRAGVAKEFGIKLNDFAQLETSPITVRIEGRDRSN